MNSKPFILKNIYKSNFKFINKNQNFIWFSLALFLIFIILGILLPIFYENEIIDFIRSLEDKISSFSAWELINFIFFNNLKSSFFALLLGIGVCIFPLAILIVNGYILGFVLNHSVQSGGILVIWKLFPHGIFEIPAILISTGLGVYLGFNLIHDFVKKYEKQDNTLILAIISAAISPVVLFLFVFIKTLFNSELKEKLKSNLYSSLNVFIFIIVPLLIIAAIIEGLLIFFLR